MSNKLRKIGEYGSFKTRVIPLGLAHFLMDYMCHFYMFRFVKGSFTSGRVVVLFALYNFLAFALQCPIGYLCDKVGVKLSVAVSFVMLGLGYFCGWLAFTQFKSGAVGALLVIVGVLIIGLANSGLHAGGVNGVMIPGEKGLKNGGIFIAFGALGVGLGDFYGSRAFDWFTWIFFVTAMFIAIILFAITIKQKLAGAAETRRKDITYPAGLNEYNNSKKANLVLVLCLAAVFARSYGAFLMPSGFTGLNAPFNGTILEDIRAAMLSSDLGFIGKLLGGFFVVLSLKIFKNKADLRVANLRYGAAALVISGLLLVFFGDYTVTCTIGILLFHSVMPVTLYEVYCLLPENPGFSLGLTTLMLFAGTLPVYVYSPEGAAKQIILAVMILVAAVCLGICSSLQQKDSEVK